MRKWTYLVAALLMAGTTATFTGCIDTDEPDGISTLRGAKAELLKADAAFRLVEAEWQKAKVAEQEIINKGKELDNEYKKYTNEVRALEVKMKELQLEREQASTEEHKAKCDQKIAEANKAKADAENAMALAAEQFNKDLLNYQTLTAQAQEAYDNAMKLIEASKLLLSDGEKAIINKAQLHLENAASAMNAKYKLLKKAQIAYNATLTDTETPTLASLEAALKIAKLAVETSQITLTEKQNILELAKDFDASEWDTKVIELKKQISEYQSEQDKAEVEESKIINSADYKAATAKITEKEAVWTSATKAYFDASGPSGAKQDSINATKENRTIEAYKSEPINAALVELFQQSTIFTSLGNSYNTSTGIFSYDLGTYKQKAYDVEMAKAEAARTGNPFTQLKAVNSWIDALGTYSVDENGVEWNKIELAKKEKAVKDAKEVLDKAKANWTISANAVKGTATTVPTVDFKKATDAYNTAYKALTDAVAAYNKAYDEVYTAAYNKHVTDTKATKLEEFYRTELYDALSSTAKAAWDQLSDNEKTTSKLEALLGDATKQAQAKTDADKTLATFYTQNDGAAEKALVTAAKGVGNAALAADKDKKIENADKALVKANTEVVNAETTTNVAIGTYEAFAKLPYGQIFTNTDGVDEYIGTGAFYGNDADNAGHKKALRSDMSADEFTKLTATTLDETTAKAALTATSNVAFGNKSYSGGLSRLVEVTEAMVRDYIKGDPMLTLTDFGKLGIKMVADNELQLCKDMIAAADLIKPLKAEMEKVLVNLNAEITANTALMNPFITAANEARIAVTAAAADVATAKAEREALTAETTALISKYKDLVGSYEAILVTVQQQIDDITTGDPDGTTVAAIINYWENQVATAEEAIEDSKKAVIAAEKTIELFKKGEYSQAYVVEQARIKMEAESEVYNAAKAVYDSALAQVQKVLETLTK